jgi:1-acyl-sn-glycerol-3-phosphate acyltransferase
MSSLDFARPSGDAAAVRRVLSTTWGIVSTALVGMGAVALFWNRARVLRLGRAWARSVMRLAGVRVEVEGRDRLGPGPFIFMGNHESNLDTLVLVSQLPLPWAFVAKASLRRVPLLGQGMAAGGMIFIDRRNRGRAFASLRRAGAVIREGTNVVIFPEGTRTRDGRPLPFKKGPFHLAIEAKVPVVPLALVGTGRLWPVGKLGIRPGKVKVRFGEPIAVSPATTVEALSAQVRTAIDELRA